MSEESESKKSETNSSSSKLSKHFNNMRENPWMPATIVLAIALIVVLALGGFGGMTGNVVKESVAAENLISFINSQGGPAAELVSVEEKDGFYEVTVKYDGEDIPVLVTMDGKQLVSQTIPLTGNAVSDTQSQPQQEIPKSLKPKVELFVMSYCPYGTQMEKGILPVLDELGSWIDADIKFVHYVMHGDEETEENFRQICIREEQGTKFNAYLQCILNSTSVYDPANQTQCMINTGINTATIDSCMKERAEGYYQSDSALSQQYGVQGSPTLVINGVIAESGRSPAAILNTICQAFENVPPQCSNLQLATESPSPGFGFNSGSSADSAAANCGV